MRTPKASQHSEKLAGLTPVIVHIHPQLLHHCVNASLLLYTHARTSQQHEMCCLLAPRKDSMLPNLW
jgi:hypothetical protein